MRCFAGPISMVSFFNLEDLEARTFPPDSVVFISGTLAPVSSAFFVFFELLLNCMQLITTQQNRFVSICLKAVLRFQRKNAKRHKQPARFLSRIIRSKWYRALFESAAGSRCCVCAHSSLRLLPHPFTSTQARKASALSATPPRARVLSPSPATPVSPTLRHWRRSRQLLFPRLLSKFRIRLAFRELRPLLFSHSKFFAGSRAPCANLPVSAWS